MSNNRRNSPAPTAPTGDPVAVDVERPTLSVKAVVAAVNDGDGDPDVIAVLNRALYRFGAQDPSMELARSWQRVQRRIGADKLDGIATAEQVAVFADRAGLSVTR